MRFEVASYDPTRALIIDPVLDYATYLGGSSSDYGLGIAVDTSGNAYVTGFTTSVDFPMTLGSLDSTYNNNWDAFVVKLNPEGSALEYSTYLGGSSQDVGITVDPMGNAYVSGYTFSTNCPTTAGLSTRLPTTTTTFVWRN